MKQITGWSRVNDVQVMLIVSGLLLWLAEPKALPISEFLFGLSGGLGLRKLIGD